VGAICRSRASGSCPDECCSPVVWALRRPEAVSALGWRKAEGIMDGGGGRSVMGRVTGTGRKASHPMRAASVALCTAKPFEMVWTHASGPQPGSTAGHQRIARPGRCRGGGAKSESVTPDELVSDKHGGSAFQRDSRIRG